MKEAHLTGPNNFGIALHKYLTYPMKYGVTGTPYTVSCYLGKQVRDNIDTAALVLAYTGFAAPPRPGEVYNDCIVRFLPCTTTCKPSKLPRLVRVYLRDPHLSRLLGQ
jgi:hypothetical protein